MARLGAAAVVVALVVAGCDDDGGGQPQGPQTARPATATGAVAGGPGSKNLLVEKPHIEDRVTCPIPEQPTDPRDGKCDPKAPSCGEHLYCLPLAQGAYCEPCPERDGIRHAFKERDFDTEHNRDPFQSLLQPLGPSPTVAHGLTKKCPHADQLIAPGSSYVDLKLVGIVAQGTQRKVLMMAGPLGWIIKRGDCVGKEKAVVKDIGTGYITFQLDPDGSAANQRAPEEYSVQLNPKQLSMNEAALPSPAPRTPAPRTPSAPVAPPGTMPGAPAAPAGSPPVPGVPGAPGGSQAAAASPVVPAPGSTAPPVEAPPMARKP